VDAQLDAEQQAHLRIHFDTLDVPARQFLFAGEAWECVASGAAPAEAFGHGQDTGAWFMRVNLARDWLALHGQEVSQWDGWRDIPQELRHVDEPARRWCDGIAAQLVSMGASDDTRELREAEQDQLRPFWRA